MKNIFKRIVASAMAVASLNVGMVGMGTCAIDTFSPVDSVIVYSGPSGSVSFGDRATATIYASSTQVNLSTTRQVTTYQLYAGIAEFSNGQVDDSSTTAFNTTAVYHNTRGSNISNVRSYHYYDLTEGSPSDRVEQYCRY